MSGALFEQARKMLSTFDPGSGRARRVGRLTAFDGVMLEATGLSQSIGGGARVIADDGRMIRAEVVGFKGNRSLLVALDGQASHASGARVEPDGIGSWAEVGAGLLGRVIDGLGKPLDGLGPINAQHHWPLTGKLGSPLDRGRVKKTFDTGVRAINALLTAGVGQRIAIMAGSGVGKSVLLGQMIAGADAEVIVVGLVGERSREVSDFLETRLSGPVRQRSVTVAVPADHPPVLRLRAAMRATAIAEYFRDQGLRVLLMIDSLTRVAHAQREIGLALGEPPTMKGYPPSALSIIPALIERAGANARGSGSITALYTVLADGGDLDDPIVDAARAIVDGHIILSRQLAEQGIFPAIDVGRSLSRVMADLITPQHRAAAINYRKLWSAWEENRDLIMMGAYREGGDPDVDMAIARRHDMITFLQQSADEQVGFIPSIESLCQGFGA
jgi:flagellum-specific ATP synthase